MANISKPADHLLTTKASRRSAGGATHKALVARILQHYPMAKTSGFIQGLLKLPDAVYVPGTLSDSPEWRAAINMIPDAWWIDAASRRVLIFEAVHRHDVDEQKFGRMIDLAWALDEDRYALVLVRVTSSGVSTFRPQDVFVAYNLEQARQGFPTTDNDVPTWEAFPVERTDAMLKHLGGDPLAGLIAQASVRVA